MKKKKEKRHYASPLCVSGCLFEKIGTVVPVVPWEQTVNWLSLQGPRMVLGR